MNFGGPVWHCSVRHPSREKAKALARAGLDGVGDPVLGEWEEWHKSFHLRRRLSAEEAKSIGPVVDIRGTIEAWSRFDALPPLVRMATGNEPL